MTLATPRRHAHARADERASHGTNALASGANAHVRTVGGTAGRPVDPGGDSARVLGEMLLVRCVDVLSEAFASINPGYMARVRRIAGLVEQIAGLLDLEQPTALARLALVSQFGNLSLAETTALRMHRGDTLTSSERQHVRDAPNLGEQLVAQLPGHEREREIVRLHDVHATPVGAMPIEADVLRVAIGYDGLEAGGKTPNEAIAILRQRAPMYSPTVVDVLERHLLATRPLDVGRSVPIAGLLAGMILTADLLGSDGLLILRAGHEINAKNVDTLQALHSKDLIESAAWIRGPGTNDGR